MFKKPGSVSVPLALVCLSKEAKLQREIGEQLEAAVHFDGKIIRIQVRCRQAQDLCSKERSIFGNYAQT